MKVITTVLALWVASAVIAAEPASQPPVPSTGEDKSKPPESKPAAAQQPPTSYQRGTERSPVIVKVQPTQKTQEEAAGDQADRSDEAANERLALWLTASTVLILLLQLGMSGVQAWIAARQNKILKNQSALMAAMIDRAWLKAAARITGPFKRSEDGNTISITVTVDVANVGRAPATKVAFHVMLYTVQDHVADFNKPLLERDAACANLRQRTFDTRFVVFPDQRHPYTVNIHADAPGIAPDHGLLPFPIPLAHRAEFMPVIGGCVDYQFAGSTRHHQTGFLYQLWRPDKDRGPNHFLPFGPDSPCIAADEMELTPHPMGGFYAD